MKAIKFLLLTFLFISTKAGFSQEPRGKAKAKRDSINRMTPEDKRKEINKFTKLDLSQQQLDEIKEIQSTGKKARADVKNDNSLTPEQKKQKIKELHKEQSKKVMQLLTPEQRKKFKDIGRDKLDNKDEEKD